MKAILIPSSLLNLLYRERTEHALCFQVPCEQIIYSIYNYIIPIFILSIIYLTFILYLYNHFSRVYLLARSQRDKHDLK